MKKLTTDFESISIKRFDKHIKQFGKKNSQSFFYDYPGVKLHFSVNQHFGESMLTIFDSHTYTRVSHQNIFISEQFCFLGGKRYWFQCPDCVEQKGVLFIDEGLLKCRTCLDLAYPSQRENHKSPFHILIRAERLRQMQSKLWNNGKNLFYRGLPTKRLKKLKDLLKVQSLLIDDVRSLNAS